MRAALIPNVRYLLEAAMTSSEGSRPDLILSYVSTCPDELIQPFVDAIATPAANVKMDRREPEGPFAGMEWLLPTAVILYVAKSYFDGMLKEAGKEHYQVLKAKLPLLWEKFFGSKRAVRTTVISSTPGKVEATPTFSRTMSLMAEGPDGLVIKLLLQDNAPPHELDAGVDRFFTFLAEYHQGIVAERIAEQLRSIRPIGRQILVAYDPESGTLSVIDPRPPSGNGKHGV